jgi:hypothetical protein
VNAQKQAARLHISWAGLLVSIVRTAGEAVFLEQLGCRRPHLAGNQTDESVEHLLEYALACRKCYSRRFPMNVKIVLVITSGLPRIK